MFPFNTYQAGAYTHKELGISDERVLDYVREYAAAAAI